MLVLFFPEMTYINEKYELHNPNGKYIDDTITHEDAIKLARMPESLTESHWSNDRLRRIKDEKLRHYLCGYRIGYTTNRTPSGPTPIHEMGWWDGRGDRQRLDDEVF